MMSRSIFVPFAAGATSATVRKGSSLIDFRGDVLIRFSKVYIPFPHFLFRIFWKFFVRKLVLEKKRLNRTDSRGIFKLRVKNCPHLAEGSAHPEAGGVAHNPRTINWMDN
jgi:hypothetical protein